MEGDYTSKSASQRQSKPHWAVGFAAAHPLTMKIVIRKALEAEKGEAAVRTFIAGNPANILPQFYSLGQNYPNPFNYSTKRLLKNNIKNLFVLS